MSDLFRGLASLVAGTVGAAARFVFLFFPGSIFLEMVAFAAIGGGLAYLWPRHRFRWAAISVVPAVITILLTLQRLGLDKLRDGVGTSHVFSLVAIPLAALVTAFLVGQRRPAASVG